jgi:CBS domain containing-hemolysin-like protein
MEDLFEEVVGEIEEGRGRVPIVRVAPGRVQVRGTVRLSDVGEALGMELEHPKVTTVSGLVLLLLGGPASVGAVVTWNNLRIEVVSVVGRGVADAVVTRLAGPLRSAAHRAK